MFTGVNIQGKKKSEKEEREKGLRDEKKGSPTCLGAKTGPKGIGTNSGGEKKKGKKGKESRKKPRTHTFVMRQGKKGVGTKSERKRLWKKLLLLERKNRGRKGKGGGLQNGGKKSHLNLGQNRR